MKLAQISHFLLHIPENRTREYVEHIQTCLAVIIGVFFGLLTGMTFLVALPGSWGASHAGEPGMLFIKVLIIGTFVILSVILFTRGSDSREEEDNSN